MATAALGQPESDQYRRIAAPLHTVLVLAVQFVLAYVGKIHTDQARAAVNLDRIRIYERTILFEWLILALVIAGVWLNGSPLRVVLGDRWRSAGEVLRDIGIGLAFLLVCLVVMSMFGAHTRAPDPAVAFLLPHGRLEISIWIALSATAGICEEALYRGYLQRQFMAMTKSVAFGILLSAAAFGGAHAYQGWWHTVQVGLLGAMTGVLAYWRKSVRPGMISHASQDLLAIFVRH
jgi:uncharacterized protein